MVGPVSVALLVAGSLAGSDPSDASRRWEPSALFHWLVYVAFPHARSLRGWYGARSAVFLVVALLTAVFAYFGNSWFGSLPAYSGMEGASFGLVCHRIGERRQRGTSRGK